VLSVLYDSCAECADVRVDIYGAGTSVRRTVVGLSDLLVKLPELGLQRIGLCVVASLAQPPDRVEVMRALLLEPFLLRAELLLCASLLAQLLTALTIERLLGRDGLMVAGRQFDLTEPEAVVLPVHGKVDHRSLLLDLLLRS